MVEVSDPSEIQPKVDISDLINPVYEPVTPDRFVNSMLASGKVYRDGVIDDATPEQIASDQLRIKSNVEFYNKEEEAFPVTEKKIPELRSKTSERFEEELVQDFKDTGLVIVEDGEDSAITAETLEKLSAELHQLEIDKERELYKEYLANGEITQEDYDEMLEDLEDYANENTQSAYSQISVIQVTEEGKAREIKIFFDLEKWKRLRYMVMKGINKNNLGEIEEARSNKFQQVPIEGTLWIKPDYHKRLNGDKSVVPCIIAGKYENSLYY